MHLTSPLDGEHFDWPANVECNIGPVYAPADGVVSQVHYYDGTNEVGVVEAPFSLTLTNLSSARHWLTAVATNDGGRVLRSLPHRISLAPSNDRFAARVILSGPEAVIVDDNSGATSESGEPQWSEDAVGQTLWYSWTAPENGTVTVSPVTTNFIPFLGVFTGESLTNLAIVATNTIHYCCELAGCRDYQHLPMTFNVRAGSSYQVSVDGYSYSSLLLVLSSLPQPGVVAGRFALRWSFAPTPDNDDFSRRLQLTGSDVLLTNSNAGASGELGEPIHDWNSNSLHSIWYSWTAPANGLVTLDSITSSLNAASGASASATPNGFIDSIGGCNPPSMPIPKRVFAIYEGISVSNLTLVARGNSVRLLAEKGMSYSIACDGEGGSVLEAPFHLVLHARPWNDDFRQSGLLRGVRATGVGTLFGATREVGEPNHNASASPSTVWWEWNAAMSGLVRVWTHSPGYLTGNFSSDPIAIYVGDSIEKLIRVPWDSDTQEFYAREGTTYRIVTYGYGAYPTDFEISITPATEPPFISSDNSSWLPDGGFAIGISCQTGERFVLQASTNLVNWETTTTNTALDVLTELVDPESGRFPRRFYRVLPLESLFVPSASNEAADH